MLQCFSDSIVQWLSASVAQSFNASVLQCFSGSIVQWLSASVAQSFSASVLQCFSLAVLTRCNCGNPAPSGWSASVAGRYCYYPTHPPKPPSHPSPRFSLPFYRHDKLRSPSCIIHLYDGEPQNPTYCHFSKHFSSFLSFPFFSPSCCLFQLSLQYLWL